MRGCRRGGFLPGITLVYVGQSHVLMGGPLHGLREDRDLGAFLLVGRG